MKLKSIIISGFLFSSMIFVSCNSKEHGDTDPTLPQFGLENKLQPSMQPVDSLPAAVNNNQEIKNSVALNPPHGQPGHDCSVAVGAPLNQPVNTMPSPNLITPPANSSTRLNPPHGQPGHSCEIPVGQPLP